METNTTPAKLHPALWVAAIAVTTFSVVGIGALTGVIGNKTEAPAPVAATAPPPAPVAVPAPEAVPAPAPVAVAKPVAKVARAPRPATTYSTHPHRNSNQDGDTYSTARNGVPRDETVYSTREPVRSNVCASCGTVEAVNAIVDPGQGSGIGAVAGGVIGGILGNQIGKGDTRDVARIAGIAGGAFAGHQIEKSQRSNTHYDVVVRMEDGSIQHIRQGQPMWQAGDRVRVDGGNISLR